MLELIGKQVNLRWTALTYYANDREATRSFSMDGKLKNADANGVAFEPSNSVPPMTLFIPWHSVSVICSVTLEDRAKLSPGTNPKT